MKTTNSDQNGTLYERTTQLVETAINDKDYEFLMSALIVSLISSDMNREKEHVTRNLSILKAVQKSLKDDINVNDDKKLTFVNHLLDDVIPAGICALEMDLEEFSK